MRTTRYLGVLSLLLGGFFLGNSPASDTALLAQTQTAANNRQTEVSSPDTTPNVTQEAVCPNDMVNLGSYCIDTEKSKTKENWFKAAEMCDAAGKRLCTNGEWLKACDGSPINQVEDMPGLESQWLDQWVYETSTDTFVNLNRGYFRCSSVSHPWPNYRPRELKWFRCCRSTGR
jgi:hypothetical protein